ncbi:hypothetical protein AM493_04805 [Flavobacterium akiainvivens]|uniref:DUF3800 domain-containing protein n=1 Tax=Flavobacterium akiainvivens TaxID=1202724 RepID=A0A0M8M829_9FLAO|nr:DUF3800 domain-containing protein [Flavobacterium akiainvivens]KOS05423.1 hypothetical protein AM493_04805 [Flavobacterium akiainvivens]SFQ78202.1 hypothetical protein SAMN05444144_12910 [Flavobacterium akiainvivens]
MAETFKKTNYFYIDESGHINNNSNVFIQCCIKTDTPDLMEEALVDLQEELLGLAYFEEFVDKIKKQGFHAVENHPDIRARFYTVLPFLNYRAYFTVVDKNSDYFKKLKNYKEDHEIFEFFLIKLLKDRLLKNKFDKNIFIFEEIEIEKKSLSKILDSIFSSLSEEYDCAYSIESKKTINLGTTDYLNYIIYNILEDLNKTNLRMEQNFNLIKHKVGVVHFLHNNVYLSRKKSLDYHIEVTNLKKQFSG